MIKKICGITRVEDARAAVRAGADWLGLNFWPGSKRAVGIGRGAELALAARAEAVVLDRDLKLVGVFVNQDDTVIRAAASRAGLDLVQLHGDEALSRGAACRHMLTAELDRPVGLIQALPLRADGVLAQVAEVAVDYLLFDTPSADYGGSGQIGDWSLARMAIEYAPVPVLLAGGLTPDNVAGAIREALPSGVDVASGVESAPGIKDEALMNAFVKAATDSAR